MKTKTKKAPKKITKYLVDLVEHDSWSGPKTIETKEFTDKSKADAYIAEIHSHNTAPSAPEYYLTAELVKTYEVTE